MEQKTLTQPIGTIPQGKDMADRINIAISHNQRGGRAFFVLLLQIQNIEVFGKQHPRYVVLNLYKELYAAVRKIVHPTQFVGYFQDGLGLVFDAVDVGQVDVIAKKLSGVAMRVIRDGQYNDLKTRWTDILRQFLHPNQPSMILPRVGWAICPRDGVNAVGIVKRALQHGKELNR